MTSVTQGPLYQAVKSHTLNLEIKRGGASGADLEVLNGRIADCRLLLEWLSQALELGPPASPVVETPPPSSSQADQDQIRPSARPRS
jgi:hypothetical protein